VNLKTAETEIADQSGFYGRILRREVGQSETQYWATLSDIWMANRAGTSKVAEQLMQDPAFEPIAALMQANQAISKGEAHSALKWLSGSQMPHISLALMQRLVEIEAHALLEGRRAWTAEELAEVEAIAQLCPSEYGKAVFQARVLLLRKYGKSMDQYGQDCDRGMQPVAKVVAEPESAVALGIFPNPTHADVTVEYRNPSVQSDAFVVRVFSTLGVLVREVQVLGQEGYLKATLSTEGLENGTYFVQIWGEGRALATGRLLKMN
jgi:hypothetical protein